jgi:hypothetical protein
LLVALRRALVFTHRWLGIAGGLLVAAWFLSGITMMYARMPRLAAEERLARAAVFDASGIRVSLADAARDLSGPADRVRIGMLLARPVYRFQREGRWRTVFADDGQPLKAMDETSAIGIANAFSGSGRARAAVRLDRPDQWTLEIRSLLPAYRVDLGDAEGTTIYVAESTGDVVMRTSRRSRGWAYAGAIVHWLYFTPLRQHATMWTNVVIWSSLAGCVLCLSGLVWGVWQVWRTRRSPYDGLMRWHHYAGLVFGALTLAFVFSGLLSMEPWDWTPGTAPARAQREAVSGGSLDLTLLTIPTLQTIAQTLAREMALKEIELLRFRGRTYAEAYRSPAVEAEIADALGSPADVIAARLPLEHRLVPIDDPVRTLQRFSDGEIVAAARAAMAAVDLRDAAWLTDYDTYYYDRARRLPLPVLRVRYQDPPQTWLYFDPYRGSIIRKEERLTRVNRWLYRGLHSWDFPGLYRRRPLWDIVVIAISIGCLVAVFSSAPAGVLRLRRLVLPRRAQR